MFGKATSKETSSPEVVPTATGKKLALPKPHSSSMNLAVSPLVTDGASTSDSICEMNGLRLIDLSDLLASVTRRANCNVYGSGLTVRESLTNRRGLCNKLTLSCTNPLCTGVDAFSEVYSGRVDVWQRECRTRDHLWSDGPPSSCISQMLQGAHFNYPQNCAINL